MKEKKILVKYTKVYCEDQEKTIDQDGCYDAQGSTICRTCSTKPASRKVHMNKKDKQTSWENFVN